MFAVGGFIAPHLALWAEAERLWQNRLDRDEIAYFRSVDCQNVHGPFEKFRTKKNQLSRSEREKVDSIRSELIQVIIECGLMGFGFGLLMADYWEVKKISQKDVLGDVPYHLAYQLAITRAGLILHECNMREQILGFVCDEHEQYSFHAKATYDELRRKNPIVADNLGSLSYLDDQKSPAVQMADLMAYEAMHKTVRWMDRRVGDRAAFVELKPAVYKIEMADKVWLEEFVKINSAA